MHASRLRLAFAALAALAAAVVAPSTLGWGAPAAGASTAPPIMYSREQAAYAIYGGPFHKVCSTITLPDPATFAKDTTSYGYSVQLWSGNYEVTLGLSDTTSNHGPYSPALAIFDRTKTAPNDLVAVANDFGSYSIPAGHKASLCLNYDRFHGVMNGTVSDLTAGSSQLGGADIDSTTEMFRQVRIGAEVGCYAPWDPAVVSGCGGVITRLPAPPDVRFGTFTTPRLTTYAGKTYKTLTGTGLTTKRVWATSDGTATGLDEMKSGLPYNSATTFDVSFQS
jgi:hypothetical protein